MKTLKYALVLWAVLVCFVTAHAADEVTADKDQILTLLHAQLHPADFMLVETHAAHLSAEQLQHIFDFMVDPTTIATSAWFNVADYENWDDYNFQRPLNEQIITLLARRDIFLDPARQLNNPAVTNLSAEALAALTFSQVYVEETWDQEPPWDNDSNKQFNWVHPDLLKPPVLGRFMSNDFLYQERVSYWYATYWSMILAVAHQHGIGGGTDEQLVNSQLETQAPRLAGYSYPLGNQLYTGTAETVYWFTDYLDTGEERYGEVVNTQTWDTRILFRYPTLSITTPTDDQMATLQKLFAAPFARALRLELTHPETASFWNTMRFIHAAARQREGGASPAHPENGQPGLLALRYHERSAQPVGRGPADVSVFAILTTIYSDSLLLDFTNWDFNQNTLLVAPADTARSDGLHRTVSERNKAVLVTEHLGSEMTYPNATHISGSRGLGFQLLNQYDDPQTGDFLPYTPEEAYALVSALTVEARDYQLEASRVTLCQSPLLRRGYEVYAAEAGIPAWEQVVSGICPI